jgi:hypothetical protein
MYTAVIKPWLGEYDTLREIVGRYERGEISGFIDIDSTHDFPEKPKWMRWHTYRRLRAKDSQLMRAYEDGIYSTAAAFLRRHG